MYRKYVKKIKAENKNTECSVSQHAQQNSNEKTVSIQTPLSVKSESSSKAVPPPPPPPPLRASGPLVGTTVSNNNEKTPQAQAGPSGDNKTEAKGNSITEEQKAKQRIALEAQKQLALELQRKIDETMAMLQNLSVPTKGAQAAGNALIGNIDMECPSPAKIVRIFTSSTFTDTKQERNTLMKFAYPKIKEHCRKIGYEFQVVDMRWGIRDEATDDHMTTELCLKELKLCQKLSTGPNFVSLLSHKYGYTPFPRVIEAEEFETIFANIENPETKDLFQKWYTRDDNAVPPGYILSSISTHIPDFLSNDKDKQKTARDQWWEQSQQMQDALGDTAKKLFDAEKARKYIMSVTETETEEGLKHEEARKNVLWLNRNIEDIEGQESSYALSRYIECLGPEEKVKRARQLLNELKEDKMKSKLDPKKILNYSVNWSRAGGINPDEVEEHKKYLETLCSDFVSSMVDMIDKSVAEKEKVDNPLVDECMQHIRFCQAKCEGFSGQKETLEKIKAYVTSSGVRQPLVLHGPSGTGKTSIMAMAAKMSKTWLNKKPVLILRFLGTTPESSNLMSLLHSICAQIRRAYKLPAMPRVQDINIQIADFKMLLIKGRADQPLILFLDSLDQLDPAYDARQMGWLFRKVTAATRVVVSTLPEPVYQCFPALQSIIETAEHFVSVPILDHNDVGAILNNWLQMRQRKLADKQREVILQAFDKCPTPLFLKLSFDESISWTSFHPLDRTVLQTTVRSSIEHLFENLEKLHGKVLVTRALAYLTLTRSGASEAELEDILSCDDDVLNDVYMYWTPPMRRLPPLLLVRIRNDLSQYLVERGTDGTRVMYWYHRQFIEAAEARYCSEEKLNKVIHANLADFFNGTWANGNMKPYTTAKGETGEEDRRVSAQPLKFGEKDYNLRALNNLPYHRLKAGQEKQLEQQCLANIPFLICKLSAMPMLNTFEDFSAAKALFPDNSLIKLIHESLLLSQKGLITDPGQIVPQLLGRLDENDITQNFLKQCRAYPHTYIEPTKRALDKPGGQLVHCISAHKTDIDMMDMTENGKLVVTVCQSDKEVKLWDIEAGKLKRDVKNKGQCTEAFFCNNDQWLICMKDKAVSVEEVETGKGCFEVAVTSSPMKTCICVAGEHRKLLFVCSNETVLVYDLRKEGQLVKTLIHPEKMKFGSMSIPRGTTNYVALCDDEQYFITVLDLNLMKFNEKFRGFEKVLTEDGDYDEHEVEAVAIHPDENQLVYTTMFTSEIVFADFHGNKLKNIPADEEKSFRSLDFSPDGQHIYVHDGKRLVFYDTNTLQEIDCLEHRKDVVAAKTRDMKTVVTVAEDSNLRIWDRTKGKQDETEEEQGELKQIQYLRTLWPLPSSRYILVVGGTTRKDPDRIIAVYDFIKEKYVKKRSLSGIDVSLVANLDAKRVLMEIKRKVHVFNLDTMEIDMTFQGFTPAYQSEYTVTKRNQLVGLSRSQKNLKVYDLSTGKVAFILKAGQTMKIDSFTVNEQGTVAFAQTDEGPLLLFDLVDQKVLYTIPSKPTYSEYFGFYKMVSDDGTKLLFSTDQCLPGLPKGDDVDHLVAWDIQNKKEMFRMFDIAYAKKYKLSKSDDTTSVDDVFRLDSNRVLTSNFDNIIRVYDFNTGKLLSRLEGHTTSVKVALNEKSPYILTYGSFSEEDCIRIWDKETYKQIASYSLDKTISDVHWSECGRFFYTTTNTSEVSNITRWNIHYGHSHVTDMDLNEIPEIFSPNADFESLMLDIPEYDQKNFVPEEGDPDTDPEIISDDDEDDEDDGDD